MVWLCEVEATCLPILMRHAVLQESKTYENASVAPAAGGGTPQTQPAAGAQPQRPAHAKEYNFLDMELKYGFLQVKQTTPFQCVVHSMTEKDCVYIEMYTFFFL